MKVEQLMHFQYSNPATTYMVRATEYSDMASKRILYIVSVIDNDHNERFRPVSKSEALQLAEAKIAGFLQRMNMVYLT